MHARARRASPETSTGGFHDGRADRVGVGAGHRPRLPGADAGERRRPVAGVQRRDSKRPAVPGGPVAAVRGVALVRLAPVRAGVAVPVAGMTVETVRDAVLPVLATYLFFVALLVLHARDRRRTPAGDATRLPTWPELIRYLALLGTMGYVVFLAIVFVF